MTTLLPVKTGEIYIYFGRYCAVGEISMNRILIPFLLTSGLILVMVITGCATVQQDMATPVPTPSPGSMTMITALEQTYPAYLSTPGISGEYPGIVLLHSFNGLEEGYKEMSDRFASEGFVVIAPEWQTYNQRADDAEVEAVIRASVETLKSRPDVDTSKIGLTGFCAGGRYTMLFLPQMNEFDAGVAWYGFPYSRGFANDTTPASHIGELAIPMLIIHGSRDRASPVTDIYNYTQHLDASDKYFELKVYQGKPHGFIIANGSLVREEFAENAYDEMITFFKRRL